MLKNFVTYQKSIEFYKAGKYLKWPKHQRDQWLRASASISLNLAEGSAKPTKKDQKRFYYIAYGSLLECISIMDLEDVNDARMRKLGNDLSALLYKLTRY